jgi:actin-related protein
MSVSRSDENSSQIYEEQQHSKKNSYENMFQLANLEDMICQSIMSVNNPEMRKKLANCIILVGGGSKFKGIVDFIEDRLIDKLTTYDKEIDRVEIIQLPGVDMKTIHWIGGTIIPKLDSSKDMWISRERWLGEFEKADEIKEQKEKDLKEKENVSVAEATETVKVQIKKKDRHLDGGVKILREKSAFAW